MKYRLIFRLCIWGGRVGTWAWTRQGSPRAPLGSVAGPQCRPCIEAALRATPVLSVTLARHLPRSVTVAGYCFVLFCSDCQWGPMLPAKGSPNSRELENLVYF
jgi:hypothetical protein